jgi:hypothetical protein
MPTESRLARLERRMEALEERLANVLAALADLWSGLSVDGKDAAARIARAVAAQPPRKRHGKCD